MSKAKDIEAALDFAEKRLLCLSSVSTTKDWQHDNDISAPRIKKALTSLRQARESVDLEQLREALSNPDSDKWEYLEVKERAAQAWLDFMEGE